MDEEKNRSDLELITDHINSSDESVMMPRNNAKGTEKLSVVDGLEELSHSKPLHQKKLAKRAHQGEFTAEPLFSMMFDRPQYMRKKAVEVSISTLPQVFRDPRKYVANSLKRGKSERVWSAVTGFSNYLDQSRLLAYGKSQGLNDADAKELSLSGSMQADEHVRGAAEDIFLELLLSRRITDERRKAKVVEALKQNDGESTELGLFGKDGAETFKKLIEKEEIAKVISEHGLNRDELTKEAESELGKYKKGMNQSGGKINMFGYRELLKEKLNKDLESSDSPQDRQKILRNIAALDTINRVKGHGDYDNPPDIADVISRAEKHMQYFGGNEQDKKNHKALKSRISKLNKIQNYLNKKYPTITPDGRDPIKGTTPIKVSEALSEARSIELEIEELDLREQLQQSNLDDTSRREIENSIEKLQYSKEALQKVPMMQWQRRIGIVQQTFDTMSYFSSPNNVLAEVLNGRFFYKVDGVSPGAEGKFNIPIGKDKPGSSSAEDVDEGEEGQAKMLFGKEQAPKLILPRDDILPAYGNITKMYYLTPSSILRSAFWNGEGFFYRAEMRQREALRVLLNDSSVVALMDRHSDKLQMVYTEGKLDPKKLSENYPEVLDILLQESDSDAMRALLYSCKKDYTSAFNSAKVGNFIRENVQQKLSEPISRVNDLMNRALRKVMENPMKGLFRGNNAWQNSVEGFFSGNIGLYQLVEGAAGNLLKAVTGTATSGVFNAATWVITKILYAGVEPIARELSAAMIYIIPVVILIGLMLLGIFVVVMFIPGANVFPV